MRNYVVYVWSGLSNVAVISATDKYFADRLKEWAESEGYRVEFSQDGGPEHK